MADEMAAKGERNSVAKAARDPLGRCFTIGEAARGSGLSVRTIRYYERIGLIPKARRRSPEGAPHTGGHRIYGEEDLGRLRFVRHARLLGLGLGEVRELLDIAETNGCPSAQPGYEEVLNGHLRRIDDRMEHLRGLRQAVATLLAGSRSDHTDGCTWSTCGCMDWNGSAGASGVQVSFQRRSGKSVSNQK